MMGHLFTNIEKIFQNNKASDSHQKEMIYNKKIHQGNTVWCMRKVILVWELDTSCKLITLPPHRVEALT